MKKRYVVYARYAHEQTDWELSTHTTARAAWRAADRWTRAHQCDGGNMLAHVYIPAQSCNVRDGGCGGWTTNEGIHYHPVDYFYSHEIIPVSMGLATRLR